MKSIPDQEWALENHPVTLSSALEVAAVRWSKAEPLKRLEISAEDEKNRKAERKKEHSSVIEKNN